MKLFIKNMTGPLSVQVVQQELLKLGIRSKHVAIGQADVAGDVSMAQQLVLRIALRQTGLVLLNNSVDPGLR